MQNQSIFDDCSNEMGLGGIIYHIASFARKSLWKRNGFNTKTR